MRSVICHEAASTAPRCPEAKVHRQPSLTGAMVLPCSSRGRLMMAPE